MLAHVSQGFWESFRVVVRLCLCGAFGVTAIIGAMIWYDARSKRDWWHVMLGRLSRLSRWPERFSAPWWCARDAITANAKTLSRLRAQAHRWPGKIRRLGRQALRAAAI